MSHITSPDKKLRPEELVNNAWVEYYSNTHSAWIPCAITDVNRETGEVTIDIKVTPIAAANIPSLLRRRTIPSHHKLDWLRKCLQNKTIDDEGIKVFDRFAKPSVMDSDACLHHDSLRDIANECNELFGVSGWFGIIKKDCFVSQQEANQGKWLECFRKQAQCVHDTYGEALTAKRRFPNFHSPECRYRFQGELGKGTFGNVQLAMAKDTYAYRAVKKMSKIGMRKFIDTEIANLLAMDHPHIVKLYEWFDWNETVYLVMDFCSGGTLAKELKVHMSTGEPFQESFICEVMKQLLSATTYMHGHGLLHLDIKGDNIMLTSCTKTMPPAMHASAKALAPPQERPHIMVIDLGLGFFIAPGNVQPPEGIGPQGTCLFMAPEVWHMEFSPKADVFSMGVVLFTMLGLAFPFLSAREFNKMSEQDVQSFWSRKPRLRWEKIQMCKVVPCDDAINLCKDMLKHDRHERASAAQCLQSAFVRRASSPGAHIAEASAPAHKDKIDQILKFPQQSILYKSVALEIAQQWPANQCPSVKRFFDNVDIDGSGEVHIDAIATALDQFGIGEETAIAAANSMALSRKEVVLWTEFVAACIDLGAVELQRDLRRVFDQADGDRDGHLCKGDLRKILAGKHLFGQALDDLFQDLTGGSDPETLVNWEMFCKHFGAVPQPFLGTPVADFLGNVKDLWEQLGKWSVEYR